MSQFKIVFLGTPDFAVPCLQKLIEDPHFDVVGVVTQPDRPSGRHLKVHASPVKELALKHNIPVLTPERVRGPEVLNAIEEWQAESAVVVAFGQILPREFLDLFQDRVVNVHASLLPRWRGAAPIQRAIMAGDSETGVSLQVVVQKLDAGPVLGTRKCDIEAELLAPELYDRLKQMGPDLIEVEFADWLRGHLPPKEQDEALVTIAPKIKREEGRVDWNLSAQQIYNNFRGLFGWPGMSVMRGGKLLKIKNCRANQKKQQGSIGTVAEVSQDKISIFCGSGQLEILSVQPESKSAMTVAEYLKGNPIKKGDVL